MASRVSTIKKRTKGQHALDLIFVAELYIKGVPYRQIASLLSDARTYSISYSQIAYDIKKIHKQWVDVYLHNFDVLKSRELAKIDRLESEYWDAWVASKKDMVAAEDTDTTDMHTGPGGKQTQGYSRVLRKTKRAKRDGSYRFLDGVQWCINKRCQILGLDAPKEITFTWREQAAQVGIDPDKYIDDISQGFIDAAVVELDPVTQDSVAGSSTPRSLGAGTTEDRES